MTHRVLVPRKVERQIEQIVEWLGERSPFGAARWLEACEKAVASLSANPQGWGLAPENDVVRNREIRQLFFRTHRGKNYRLLFSIEGDVVHILQLRAPGQDLASPDEL